jgi:hypothetical protein
MQEYHSALVKEVGKDILAPANLQRIRHFVQKGIATGSVLDAPADRAAVQSLINFWLVRVASACRETAKAGGTAPDVELGDTLLAEFCPDELVAAVIAPTDKWLAQQSEIDQALARRILLRLVKLREDNTTFEVRPSMSDVCADLDPRDRADEVLAELVKLGVVRVIRNAAGPDEVALRSPEMLSRWPRIKEWMGERKEFRQKATAWAEKHAAKEAAQHSTQSLLRRVESCFHQGITRAGTWLEARWRALLERLQPRQPSQDLFSACEYEEAETYRDWNAVELRLIYQKRQLDRERSQRRHVRAVLVSFVAMLLFVLAVVAVWGWLGISRMEPELTRLSIERNQWEEESQGLIASNLALG